MFLFIITKIEGFMKSQMSENLENTSNYVVYFYNFYKYNLNQRNIV